MKRSPKELTEKFGCMECGKKARKNIFCSKWCRKNFFRKKREDVPKPMFFQDKENQEEVGKINIFSMAPEAIYRKQNEALDKYLKKTNPKQVDKFLENFIRETNKEKKDFKEFIEIAENTKDEYASSDYIKKDRDVLRKKTVKYIDNYYKIIESLEK